MATYICPPCPPNTDSTLSTVGNVTGIITFAIATAATYIGYLLLFASADGDRYAFEIDALNRFQSSSKGPFNSFGFNNSTLHSTGTGGGGSSPGPGRGSRATEEEIAVQLMNQSLETFETLHAEFETLQKQSRSKLGVRRRLLWVWKRQQFVGLVSKMAALRAEVLAIKTTLILRRCINLEQLVLHQRGLMESAHDDLGFGRIGGDKGGEEVDLSLREDEMSYHRVARQLSS